MLVGLPRRAGLAGAGQPPIDAEGKRLGYGRLLLNFVTALVPLLLAVVTMGGLWWYVVIHQQVSEAAEVAGVQQLGTPGIATAPATAAELGPPPAFFIWFAAIIACSWR